MTQRVDLICDQLVAEERLKRGTKYARLAAMAFRVTAEAGLAVTLADFREPVPARSKE